jgi:hypothetical protein
MTMTGVALAQGRKWRPLVSDEQAARIQDLIAAGTPTREIVRAVGVSSRTVTRQRTFSSIRPEILATLAVDGPAADPDELLERLRRLDSRRGVHETVHCVMALRQQGLVSADERRKGSGKVPTHITITEAGKRTLTSRATAPKAQPEPIPSDEPIAAMIERIMHGSARHKTANGPVERITPAKPVVKITVPMESVIAAREIPGFKSNAEVTAEPTPVPNYPLLEQIRARKSAYHDAQEHVEKAGFILRAAGLSDAVLDDITLRLIDAEPEYTDLETEYLRYAAEHK